MEKKTFVLVHGAGDVGWYWHLVAQRLRHRGHDVVTPDLPCDDDGAGLDDYVRTVEQAIGDRDDLVVVGHSFGASRRCWWRHAVGCERSSWSLR